MIVWNGERTEKREKRKEKRGKKKNMIPGTWLSYLSAISHGLGT